MTNQGILITLEGGEGTGKTTQTKRLKAKLKEEGYDVCELNLYEPGGTREAEIARIILKQSADRPLSKELYPGVPEMVRGFDLSPLEQLYQFFFARSHQFRTVIKKELEAGKIIILDRSIDSSVVYQGHAQDPSLIDFIRSSNEFLLKTNNIKVAKTILFDLPVEIGEERVKKDRGEETHDFFDKKQRDFHEKLREGYLAELAYTDSLEADNPHHKRIQKIDASGTLDEVFELLYTEVKNVLD